MNETVDLQELEARHAALETEIDEELRRPLPDQTRLTGLKREKLRIKEEIARASGELAVA